MVRVNTIKLSQKGRAKHSVRKTKTNRPTKLRASLTPGTVVIALNGRFRGKRCIMLGGMENGMILVSGPYKVNGVPLRRLNAKSVIATSTKVNIGNIDLSKYTSEYFAKSDAEFESARQDESAFASIKSTSICSAQRKADQKTVDAALIKAIGSDKMLAKYLKSKFALSNGDMPHAMKF